MNSNRRVFLFVVYSVSIFLVLSLVATLGHVQWPYFEKVNLVSNVFKPSKEDSLSAKNDSNTIVIPIDITSKSKENFDLYQQGHFITDFRADTTQASLVSFMEKLAELRSGKKRKVRIAYFGDSMIEGDLLTQTLRKLLQQAFGGSGIGYVPITSQVSQFRQTVIDNYPDGWNDENFKSDGASRQLYLSGHLFRTSGAWVQMKDQTVTDSNAVIEKSLLCGYASQPIDILVNNQSFTVHADKAFNRIPLATDGNTGIKLSVSNDQLPIYGVSFETASGITLDNFSFRGITGIEYARIDSSFLKAVAAENPYDLIIFQYGVNLLFRPNDKNFNWYAKALLPVVNKLKNCFPGSDFMLVCTADRAFRYNGEYQSAVGIDSLIKVQALLAAETHSAFYNQFQTMGGTNSIVDWATRQPSLANKDYVHPNFRGAEILGHFMFEAMLRNFDKYQRNLKK